MAKGRVTVHFDTSNGNTEIDVKIVESSFTPAELVYYVLQAVLVEATKVCDSERVVSREHSNEIINIAENTLMYTDRYLRSIEGKKQIDNEMEGIIKKYMSDNFSKN